MDNMKLGIKDYTTNQEVKWCSGCGDYSVLKQSKLALAELGLKNEEVVFVSGVGCSSRFPYYMDTYGYHTLHGRAIAVATGVKAQNPNLSVWVSIGDGDAISIGGNHFIHAAKRNVDMVVMVMDNRIYGLTKGQTSPTSDKGIITKTTPSGSFDNPMDPVKLALGAGANFVARTTERNQKMLRQLLVEAHKHKGFSLVHVLQNCLIYNDGAFDRYVGKEKDEHTIILEHGQPILFGKERDKAFIADGLKPRVVNVEDVSPEQILVHDARDKDSFMPSMLASLPQDKFPLPMGIIRQVEGECHIDAMQLEIDEATKTHGRGDLHALISGNNTWTLV